MSKVIIIVGGQWGDEGKGKIVDFLAEKADVIARATGGNNAGHTVVVGDKTFKFHLLPSGTIHKGKLNICGNGMVIYPKQIIKEIDTLGEKGITLTEKSLLISSSAHVITEEQIEKDRKTGKKVGTTGRGIGPCYMAKVERTGLRMSEFAGHNSADARKLAPFVKDAYPILNKAIDDKKNILIEGAQGTMLDIDHGTYPYVTSSNPTAAGQCTGLGIGPKKISEVIAILKAYTTRVGRGPFPTELGTDKQTLDEGTWDKIEPRLDEHMKEAEEKGNEGDEYYQGKYLRLMGREYGTTTKRARRTGWFDSVVAKYARRINSLTSFVLTKIDCFSQLKRIRICTAYEIDGKKTEDFPTDIEQLQKAKPVYEEMDGWCCDISDIKRFDDLPAECRKYIKRIEELVGVPMCMVSVGPKRSQTIILDDRFLF
ncbi:adenylosuccinate synthetase [Candidatus Woesearchaeota archaeon]|nr:adenylosuccinate synthetase [Candidatus Woesearchaeota archaeon]